METLIQDLRYGLRMLLKNPGFTTVAVITLALGIGATAALFNVINGVLLKSLPFKDPDHLLYVWEVNPNFPIPNIPASTLNFRDWKEQNHVFSTLAGRQAFTASLMSGDQPERIQGEKVTADYFQALGIDPLFGRVFLPEEDKPGGQPVALLSKGLWLRRFGGDAEIIGRTLTLNGQATTVVGIMPNDYRPNIEFWVPLAPDYVKADRSLHTVQAIGRLAPGVTQQQAQIEMSNIASGLAEQYPDLNTGWSVNLVPVHDSIVQNIRPALLILFSAVVVVLLIACTNVANLLLARAASREKEIAIRLALGAGRLRLLRQILTESVLIALVGGALGTLIAIWGTRLLVSLNPQGIPRAGEIGVDGKVLGFALLVSITSGIIFGLAPALQASKPNLNETLKESARSSAGTTHGRRLRSILVVIEVASALVLLVGAGLLIKSFSRLQEVQPGFNRKNLLTFQIFLPPARYPGGPQQVSFYKEALRRFSSLPGVSSAAAISQAPLAGPGAQIIFSVEGLPLPAPHEAPLVSYRIISPDYFQALEIPVLDGRAFTEADNLESLSVVVVNENLAKNMWPGQNPIGKRVTVGVPLPGETPEYSTVVGVVANVKHTTLNGDTGMQMYQPVYQAPTRNLTYVIRTALDPMSMVESARSAVASLDPGIPVANVKTMDTIVYDSVAPFRFNTFLFSLFAVVALVLTVVGVYGVLSYSVAQRTQEIGIRMALGAQSLDVLRLIIRQGMVLTLAGVTIGMIALYFLIHIISHFLPGLLNGMLFGVSATDPFTFVLISLLLTAVALVACAIPARRATKVDPLTALRYE